MDASAEASNRRSEKYGIDPIKQKYYDDYSTKRNGKKHPDVIKQESTTKLNKIGVEIS
jgi:hypothetical protein